jgi:hypothetical protein
MRRVKEYLTEEHWMDIVWKLPHEVLYWSMIRSLADASTDPEHSATVIGEIKAIDVLDYLEKSLTKSGRQI